MPPTSTELVIPNEQCPESQRRMSLPDSQFDVNLMPQVVHSRVLHQYSVHFNPQNRRWIATITKTRSDGMYQSRSKALKFSFQSEFEARKFVKAYSPPKMVEPIPPNCTSCNKQFNNRRKSHHCRNCGAGVCEDCTTKWANNMVPKTYCVNINSLTIQVCKSCAWLSNAFCMALLRGQFEDVLTIYETGNINLRTPFANIKKEAMFPVHCAVLGGSLQALKWLVDTHGCPVAINRHPRTRRMLSIQTSEERSLMDLAMTGKPKLEILRYLVCTKNISLEDTKDSTLAARTLELLLRSGVTLDQITTAPEGDVSLIDDCLDSLTTIEDACIICCEREMDCVLIPCGHQVCCMNCGNQITTCPVCKVRCSVLRIFRH